MKGVYLGFLNPAGSESDLHVLYIIDEMFCLPLSCSPLTSDRNAQPLTTASLVWEDGDPLVP